MQEKTHAALKVNNQKLLATLNIKMSMTFQPDIVPKKKNKLLKTSATRTTSFFRKLNNGTKLR